MNMVRFEHRRKVTAVDLHEPWVRASLAYIWEASRADEWSAASRPDIGAGSSRGNGKWIKLGFKTEDLRSEFANVGVLGLDSLVSVALRGRKKLGRMLMCLIVQHSFVAHDSDHFAKLVLEQLNRHPERRCPIAVASNEVVELLCNHWNLSNLECKFLYDDSTTITMSPYCEFYRCDV